ncbi:hypothetical protein pipiens_018656 [Culex pipiens pipiens]|uniref:Uncharacterized protein n=1 Tax=Culex pipiens pipiens TaxID=38569 RepID=A0ABD1CAM9_CULPP
MPQIFEPCGKTSAECKLFWDTRQSGNLEVNSGTCAVVCCSDYDTNNLSSVLTTETTYVLIGFPPLLSVATCT